MYSVKDEIEGNPTAIVLTLSCLLQETTSCKRDLEGNPSLNHSVRGWGEIWGRECFVSCNFRNLYVAPKRVLNILLYTDSVRNY